MNIGRIAVIATALAFATAAYAEDFRLESVRAADVKTGKVTKDGEPPEPRAKTPPPAGPGLERTTGSAPGDRADGLKKASALVPESIPAEIRTARGAEQVLLRLSFEDGTPAELVGKVDITHAYVKFLDIHIRAGGRTYRVGYNGYIQYLCGPYAGEYPYYYKSRERKKWGERVVSVGEDLLVRHLDTDYAISYDSCARFEY